MSVNVKAYRLFGKRSSENVHFTYLKITELMNKYILRSSCRFVLQQWNLPLKTD